MTMYQRWRRNRNLLVGWYRVTRRRWIHGIAYARGTMTPGQAIEILIECQDTADYYILSGMAGDGVKDMLLEQYHDHPDMDGYVADACVYVARRYSTSPSDDSVYEALRWAKETAVEFAGDDGVEFRRVVEEDV